MSESALDQYQMHYEDMAPRKLTITRKGGKDSKMSKSNQTKVEAPAKSYSKTRGEHFKDIVIAVLVVGVIAFIAGVHYADAKNAQMTSAVKAAQTTAVAPATDVKK